MNLLDIIKSLFAPQPRPSVQDDQLKLWSYHAAPQAKRVYRALKRKVGHRQARRQTRRSYSLKA